MNIPDKIIEIIEMIPVADRGFVYCAVVNYMHSGNEPDFEMSGTARGIFELVKINLDPILKRRKRDAANRLRKKQLRAEAKSESQAAQSSITGSLKQPVQFSMPDMPALPYEPVCVLGRQAPSAYPSIFTRSERREMEKKMQKAAKIKMPYAAGVV